MPKEPFVAGSVKVRCPACGEKIPVNVEFSSVHIENEFIEPALTVAFATQHIYHVCPRDDETT